MFFHFLVLKKMFVKFQMFAQSSGESGHGLKNLKVVKLIPLIFISASDPNFSYNLRVIILESKFLEPLYFPGVCC